jgi:hypothetical protein
MRTHFPTFALATALLAGSMTFAQAAGTVGGAAGAGTMTSPSAGASPSIGPSANPGLTTPNATGRATTQIPDPHAGLQPCRTGQGTNCVHE